MFAYKNVSSFTIIFEQGTSGADCGPIYSGTRINAYLRAILFIFPLFFMLRKLFNEFIIQFISEYEAYIKIISLFWPCWFAFKLNFSCCFFGKNLLTLLVCWVDGYCKSNRIFWREILNFLALAIESKNLGYVVYIFRQPF